MTKVDLAKKTQLAEKIWRPFSSLLFIQLIIAITPLQSQRAFFTQDTIILRLNNCNSSFEICFAGISTGTNPNFLVDINGVKQNRPYGGCGTDTVGMYSTVNIDAARGPYRLDSLTIGSTKYRDILFASTKDLADSLNRWDPVAKWIYDSQFKNIVGKPKLKYSSLFYSPLGSLLSNKLGLNTVFVPKGLKLRLYRGSHRVVAFDTATGLKDSVQIIVGCSRRNYVVKTIKEGEKAIHCNNLTLLPGRRILGNQPLSPLKKTYAEFSKVPGDSCISILGLKPGKDTFTYVIRGRGGINDTTTVYVTVLSSRGLGGKHYVSQILRVGATLRYCINTDTLLPKPGDMIADVLNYCGGSLGKIAKVTAGGQEKCIQMEGINPGTDSACIVITSNEGVSDTTIFYITVLEKCKDLIPYETHKSSFEKKRRNDNAERQVDPQIIFLQIENCDDEASFCITGLNIADSSRYVFYDNDDPITNRISGCNGEDVTGIDYQGLFYGNHKGIMLPFPFTIENWSANGVAFPPQGEDGVKVNSLQEVVDVLNKWNPEGKWQLDSVHRFFTAGDARAIYGRLYLRNDSMLTEHFLPFISRAKVFSGISVRFTKGLHQLVIDDNVTRCSDDALVAVSCGASRTILKDVVINGIDSVCIGFGTLPGKITSISNLVKSGKHVNFSDAPKAGCVWYYGKKPGKDTLAVVVCDEFNFCDTTTLIVNALSTINNHSRFDTIYTSESGRICFDSLLYGTRISSFVNASRQPGTSLIYNTDDKTRCIHYLSTNTPGTDTARIIVCNVNDFCDTTTIYVTIKPRKPPLYVYKDTVVLYNSGSLCLPKDKLGIALSSPISVKNICESAVRSKVEFSLQPNLNCLGPNFFVYGFGYRGKAIGTDTACIEVTNAAGKRDTIKVFITVVPRAPHTLRDTVFAGAASKEKCLDFPVSNLSAGVDSVYNICRASSGGHATIRVKRSNGCNSGWAISYDGVNPGTDIACIVVRDKKGNADTVSVGITVVQKNITSTTLTDTISAFQMKTYCLDTVGLNLRGTIDSIWNTCPGSSGKHVVFAINKGAGCKTGNGSPEYKCVLMAQMPAPTVPAFSSAMKKVLFIE